VLRGQEPVEIAREEFFAGWPGLDSEQKQYDNIVAWVETPCYRVSTVLLPIISEDEDEAGPFETQVRGGPFSGYIMRYKTYAEAAAGHAAICARLAIRHTAGSPKSLALSQSKLPAAQTGSPSPGDHTQST